MNTTDLIFVIIIAFLIILIVGGLIYTFLNRTTTKSFWKKEVEVELFEISKLLKGGHQISLKQVVIEMDKLLDYCLKQSRIPGTTLGDRLKASKSRFSKNIYNNIWEAHKLRNKIVHEISFNPSSNQLKSAYFGLRAGVESLIK